jgi:hypothetical protein
LVEYDRLGRRTKLADPDLGIIVYGVDVIGRAWSQESPNQRNLGIKTYTEYDSLNRIVGRYEKELEGHWIFDTAITGVGQLAEAYTMAGTVKDYDRIHTYDGLGRPSETKQKLLDFWYRSRIDYDDWSRPVTSTYQRGADTPKIFSTRYNASGYIARIERAALVLWNVTKQDASNRPFEIAMGNGLIQSKLFNVHTGQLDSAKLMNGNVARLYEGYDYDPIGNATTRTQYWDAGGFIEVLHYDTLNRLDTSTIGSVALAYTYDAAGNTLTKDGTGTYTYPEQGRASARPHALSTIKAADGTVSSFNYDDNGNLKGGSAYSATWTSFDMPIHIAKNDVWAEFKYGPEHQRTSQNRNDQSSVIYAGAQEVETTKLGVTTVKTYWPNGVGVEIDRGTSATELNWTHLDRLGSPVALTTESGTIREKLEYDVWGKRRYTDDNNSTADNIAGKIDNRGFTGHEMLDALDLVHMNGRIYNPSTGRFLRVIL